MPKMTINGVEEIGYLLDKLDQETTSILKKGLYEANHVLYQEVEKNLSSIHTVGEKENRNITEKQKQGLLSSLYGSKFQQNNNELYFTISVTGYNDVITEKYPKGQPNIMILRSLEKGGFIDNGKRITVMKQQPIMRKSLNHKKKEATQKIQETVSKEVKKLQK